MSETTSVTGRISTSAINKLAAQEFNFRLHWKRWVFLLFLYALLCLLFRYFSTYFGYERYLFSAELYIAFVITLRWRILGSLFVVAAVFLELAHGLASVFYLFEIDQILDMSEFVFEAAPSYIVLALLIPVLLGVFIYLSRKLVTWRRIGGAGMAPALLLGVALFQLQWSASAKNDSFFTPTMSHQEDLYFGSTLYFIRERLAMNKLQAVGGDADPYAEYVPIQHVSATQKAWNKKPPNSSRVLLIIAEGWGLSKESVLTLQQTESLRRSTHVKLLADGQIYAKGATAAGELRELCWVVPTRLNLRKMTPESVGDCLPAQLKRAGYRTVGVHGAYGGMYRRSVWWPQVGLWERYFRENIQMGEKKCFSFPGHCDRDLLEFVKEGLQKEKSFVYWMTLNSHMPYDRRDVVSYRDDLCGSLPESSNKEQLCNYHNLHVQFFDGLASLAADPAMKGVEVLVVGDHPPLFNDFQTKELFYRDQVPMLHFIVK